MHTGTRQTRLLRSLNCDGAHGIALIAAIATLLVPLVGGAGFRDAMRYERVMIPRGQWWRFAGAHFVHFDLHHALLNATGLALLWALFARSFTPRQWLLIVALCMFTIDAGFWFLSPQVEWYVGASALLHGVFACGCIAWIRNGDPIGIVALALLAAKLAWEHFGGPLPMMGARPVLTVSHLYGACGGVLAGLLLRPRPERLY